MRSAFIAAAAAVSLVVAQNCTFLRLPAIFLRPPPLRGRVAKSRTTLDILKTICHFRATGFGLFEGSFPVLRLLFLRFAAARPSSSFPCSSSDAAAAPRKRKTERERALTEGLRKGPSFDRADSSLRQLLLTQFPTEDGDSSIRCNFLPLKAPSESD